MRFITSFTGTVDDRSTIQEDMQEYIENHHEGKGSMGREVSSSKSRNSRTSIVTADVGSQVCQDIISKRERRSRVQSESDCDEIFIQQIFGCFTRNECNENSSKEITNVSNDVSTDDTTSSNQHTCAICLDTLSYGNTNMTTTGCGHVFHLTCLLKSLCQKNLCPMCRNPLEDVRTKQQPSNILTPVSAEQIITEEISYFPNAAHAQSIVSSRHPKRCLKELLRVFGFTLLRSVAEYVHDENMPVGWYDDGESEDSDESNESEDSDAEDQEQDNDTEEENDTEQENDIEEDNEEREYRYDTHTVDGVYYGDRQNYIPL
jgi:hypothetical protein